MTTRINVAFLDNFRKTAEMMVERNLHHGYFYTIDTPPMLAYCDTIPPIALEFDKHLVTRESYNRFECHYKGTTYELEL